MLFLLPDSPCCSITSKPLSVCAHKLPGMINKLLDYISRACIKVMDCTVFRLCKIFLGYLLITILDPSPVLKQCIRLRIYQWRQDNHVVRTISIGLSSQWNLGKKMHSCPAFLIRVSSIDSCLIKSSCLLSSRTMQQLVFSTRHTGAHFAWSLRTSKPCSVRAHW